ncbi:MAG: TonB-dependent receptor, partial [Candidatus Omnitrophica bacterium]|nr:TonB-dependent receptor [Candidatus Omnitrophota bacterium]
GYEYTFNQTHSIDANIKYVRVGGHPYTPIDLTTSQITGEEIPNYQRYLSERHPDYERFDIRLNYKVNLKFISISSFISIENVFARKNVQIQYYDVENKRIKTQYQLGFFPVGGFRIEF